jgi:hypothetical protein
MAGINIHEGITVGSITNKGGFTWLKLRSGDGG